MKVKEKQREQNLIKTIKFINEVINIYKIKEFPVELLGDKIKKKGL